jgi:galactose mutarotase-like enzyme
MPSKSWILTDSQNGVWLERLEIGPRDLPGVAQPLSIVKRTLHGGLPDGVDVIEIDNGQLSFTILPTRGMGIGDLRLRDASGAVRRIGWRSPIAGPVHPKFVNLSDPSGLGWLDGFDEFLCRCGLESNGAPDFDNLGRVKYPLHGKIANRPARHVEVQYDQAAGELVLIGIVEESRFLFQNLRLTTTIRTRPGEPALRICDEVINAATRPASMQLLYHINFGGDLLDAGAQFVAPVKTLVPRNERAAQGIETWNQYAAPQAGFSEQVYLLKLAANANGRTQNLLRSPDAALGASLLFDVAQLPCFTLWKNTAARADGYVTGLEPGTNYPNPRSHEESQGRVITLAPGETRRFELTLQFHTDARSVAAAEQEIAAIQITSPPQIHNQPQPGWCAGC